MKIYVIFIALFIVHGNFQEIFGQCSAFIHDQYLDSYQLKKEGKLLMAAQKLEAVIYQEKKCNQPDPFWLSRMYDLLGACYLGLGDLVKAEKSLVQAITSFKDSTYHQSEAVQLSVSIHTNLGVLHNKKNEYKTAIKQLKAAISVDNRLDLEQTGWVLLQLGIAYGRSGEPQPALNNLLEAKNLFEQGNNLVNKLMVREELGNLYFEHGDLDHAKQILEEGLELSWEAKDQSSKCNLLYKLGLIQTQLGEFNEALSGFKRGYQIAQQYNYWKGWAQNAEGLASIYELLGEYPKAITHYRQALKFYISTVDLKGIIRNLNNFASINSEVSDSRSINLEFLNFRSNLIQEVLEYEKILQSFLMMQKDYQLDMDYFLYSGKGLLKANLNSEALLAFELSMRAAKMIKDEKGIARANLYLGRCYTDLGKKDLAINHFKQALLVFQTQDDKLNLALCHYFLGKTFFQTEQWKEAISHLREAAVGIDSVGVNIDFQFRKEFFVKVSEIYNYAAAAYVKMGNIEDGLLMIEKGRAIVLKKKLSLRSNTVSPFSLKQLQASLKQQDAIVVLANFNDVLPTLHFVITKTEVHAVEGSVENPIFKKIIKKEKEIWLNYTKNAKIDLQVLQQTNFIRFPLLIHHYRYLLTNAPLNTKSKLDELSYLLYDYLVKPVSNFLAEKKNLIIIPEEDLFLLPFETLKAENGCYLVEQFDIAYLQSLELLEILRKRQYAKHKRNVLAFGGAIYEEQKMFETRQDIEEVNEPIYENLPGSLEEITRIRNLINKTRIIEGKRVNEKHLKRLSANGQLRNYEILHFAVHGTFSSFAAPNPGLVLSQPDNSTEDGYLRPDEIEGLQIAASLVNLTSCNSGIGQIYKGEGSESLVNPFMIAGANNVIVSMWQIDDDAAILFTEEFYKLLVRDRLSFSEALSKVKKKFIEEEELEKFKSPLFWAAFVYYGDPQASATDLNIREPLQIEFYYCVLAPIILLTLMFLWLFYLKKLGK